MVHVTVNLAGKEPTVQITSTSVLWEKIIVQTYQILTVKIPMDISSAFVIPDIRDQYSLKVYNSNMFVV